LEALKVLTNVALIDLAMLQRNLGSVTVQAEFSHVALQVLRMCGDAGARGVGAHDHLGGGGGGGGGGGAAACASVSSRAAERMAEASSRKALSRILDEMIVLLGCLATPTSAGGSSVFAGWRNGVMMVQALCALDVSYFIAPARREVLLPSLLIATYYNPELLEVMEESVSSTMLCQYISCYLAANCNDGVLSSTAAAAAPPPAGGGGGCPSFPVDGLSRDWHSLPPARVASRFHLATRFPMGELSKALAWYKSGGEGGSRSGGGGSREKTKLSPSAALVCDMAKKMAGALSAEGLRGGQDEDDDDEEALSASNKGLFPEITLSEAEVLKLSFSHATCTGGPDT
jgi:hypothetical protein